MAGRDYTIYVTLLVVSLEMNYHQANDGNVPAKTVLREDMEVLGCARLVIFFTHPGY